MRFLRRCLAGLAAGLLFLLNPMPMRSLAAQQATGTITGRVTNAGDASALAGVAVVVRGTALSASTNGEGRFTIRNVPTGPHTVVIRWLGYRPVERNIEVAAGATVTVDAAMEPAPIALSELVVEGASRAPEKVTEAPAAISVVEPTIVASASVTGQAPLVLASVPGVDIVQNGVNDFNVNTRGFNSSLNRRVLVLQDGRDMSVAFLGNQEWYSMTQPLEDLGRVEMVRGPGSALYGANAFSGVISLTTPLARETLGGKFTIGGGGLETIRTDARYGTMLGDKAAIRFAGGWSRSDTWSRSRTALDGSDVVAEYAPSGGAPDTPLGRALAGLGPEARALNGQTRNATTGVAEGDRDPLQNYYGSLRFDRYLDNGAVFTVDGGASVNENETLLTGIGRVQVTKALRPWARTAYNSKNVSLSAWWNGRNSLDPQFSLRSGLPLEEKSNIFQVEGQYNRGFAKDRGRIIVGSAYRRTLVNTEGTLMNLVNDDRSDWTASGYAQLEYKANDWLKFVGASRFDDGNLYRRQFSPKGAVVVTPSDRHGFRLTYNRAFQTPNYSEFFLQVPIAAPSASPRTLESSLEGYFAAVRANAPTALTGLNAPNDLPWNFSAQTQALALGNADLGVETVDGFEFGYKGELTNRLYVSVDAYSNNLKNFVTDLLPGVNGTYPSFALTDGGLDIPATLATIDQRLALAGVPSNSPLRANIPALIAGYNQLVGGTTLLGRNALATLPDGSRAIVLSYTNAGRVIERGIEFGAGYQLTNYLKADVSYTFFDFTVREQAVGDILLPNTPRHKGNVSLAYNDGKFDGTANLRLNEAFPWAAGVFQGNVPANTQVNLTLGYRPTNWLRVFGAGTNILNQQRYQAVGGAVIGRRLLGGVTTTF
jgi:iron complex outermembrane receptor protein